MLDKDQFRKEQEDEKTKKRDRKKKKKRKNTRKFIYKIILSISVVFFLIANFILLNINSMKVVLPDNINENFYNDPKILSGMPSEISKILGIMNMENNIKLISLIFLILIIIFIIILFSSRGDKSEKI